MLMKSNYGSFHMSILTPQRGCELKLPMQSLFKHVLVIYKQLTPYKLLNIVNLIGFWI